MTAVDALILLPLALYALANRPFFRLACHQDAGWHSYWAAFRHRGVGLRQQLNMLCGCSRLGSHLLFIVWFAVFGGRNPELAARKAFLILNAIAGVALYFLVRTVMPDDQVVPFVATTIYLMITSNPYLGVHYETSERFTNLLHIAYLFAILSYLRNPSPELLGALVFIFFMTAFLFKVVALAEYGAIWMAMAALGGAGWPELGWSVAGGMSAIILWISVLSILGLLRHENLGIFGYASAARAKATFTRDQLLVAISRRPRLHCCLGPMRLLLGLAAVFRFEAMLIALAMNLGRRIVAATHFGIRVAMTNRCLSLLVVAAWLFNLHPEGSDLMMVATAWLAAAALVLVVQNRFFYFHFLPLVVPATVLAAFGVGALLRALANEDPVALPYAALVLIALLLDWRYALKLFTTSRELPLDLRLWPESDRPAMARNLLAHEIAELIRRQTGEDEHVLIWGCLPQAYVMAGRRCPVNWLNTAPYLMDHLLPRWRDLLHVRMQETRPPLVIEVEGEFAPDAIRAATGLRYAPAPEISTANYHCYCYRLDNR